MWRCDCQCLTLHLPHLPPPRDNSNSFFYFYHKPPLFKSKSTNQRTTGPVPSQLTARPHGYNGLFLKQPRASTIKYIPRTQDRTAYISQRQRLQKRIVTILSRTASWSKLSNTIRTILIDSDYVTAQMATSSNFVRGAFLPSF